MEKFFQIFKIVACLAIVVVINVYKHTRKEENIPDISVKGEVPEDYSLEGPVQFSHLKELHVEEDQVEKLVYEEPYQ